MRTILHRGHHLPGIDVPEVVNLVMFKPVHSKTKFWQMVGRGTRLRPDLFGPGLDKTGFKVFDFCGNLEYFGQDPADVRSSPSPSVSTRIFAARARIIGAIDDAGTGPGVPEAPGAPALRALAVSALRGRVNGMTADNLLVRKHMREVERWQEDSAWTSLSNGDVDSLIEDVASLPSTDEDRSDAQAKLFDLSLLTLQLAVLTGEENGADFAARRERIRTQAENLLSPTKQRIPSVKAVHDLLVEIADAEWWTDVTVMELENVRAKLRGVMKYVDTILRKAVILDFDDEVVPSEAGADGLGGTGLPGAGGAAVPQGTPGVDTAKFEEKARAYLKAHLDTLAVQKLYRNLQLLPHDLTVLSGILVDNGIGTPDDVAAASGEGLGIFLRRLVGLDRQAVNEEIERFIAGRSLTDVQLHFLRFMIDQLTANGVMEMQQLFCPPYTGLHSGGPTAVWSDDDMEGLAEVIDIFRARAAVDDSTEPTEPLHRLEA
ncbi:type I restriction-modification enzyme R subunit C-terminal domain-containing protein [Brevibacterium samyangense]|uniref:EcoEI R protein C-terminal domain-containing protein n=1 Tax=Brevibacterium samyangense TaxID=366888 RepID=A0ABN2TCS2_9MICO